MTHDARRRRGELRRRSQYDSWCKRGSGAPGAPVPSLRGAAAPPRHPLGAAQAHRADAALKINFPGYRLPREIARRDVRWKLARVDVNGVAAGRQYDGHPGARQTVAQIFGRGVVVAEVIFIQRLAQTDGDGAAFGLGAVLIKLRAGEVSLRSCLGVITSFAGPRLKRSCVPA